MHLSTFHEIFITTHQSHEGEFSYRKGGATSQNTNTI